MNKYVDHGKEIIRTLKESGYDAYFVGGFVRDYQLGIKSDDIDITTSATPKEVSKLFDKVKNTGRKFGGVTVIIGDYKYEVTTFRLESDYNDHRHPSVVRFSSNIKDDLKRRDFTINQFIMDENENVIDHFNGKVDLENKVIRTINNPEERFTEDALRMLRAFRFVSKLGFTIEDNTLHAIVELKDLLLKISNERVLTEFNRIVKGPHQKSALQYMYDTGVTKLLLKNDEGIKRVLELEEHLTPMEVLVISVVYGADLSTWRLSNMQRELIEQTAFLHEITKEDEFNKFMIFSNKLEPCLLVNKINVLLGYPNQKSDILKKVEEMPVMDVCDLAFKGQDILMLTELKNKRIIGRVIDDILIKVIIEDMPNDYEIIKEFALKRIEQYNKELGENNYE